MKTKTLSATVILVFLLSGCAKVVEPTPPPSSLPMPAAPVRVEAPGPYDRDIPQRYAKRLQQAGPADEGGVPYIFLGVGAHFEAEGDETRALHFYERAGEEFQRRGDAAGKGTAANRVVLTLHANGRIREALDRTREREESRTGAPDSAFTSYLYGYFSLMNGEYSRAKEALRRCLGENRTFGEDVNLLLLRRDAELAYGLSAVLDAVVPRMSEKYNVPNFEGVLPEAVRGPLEEGISNLSHALVRNEEIRKMPAGASIPDIFFAIAEVDANNYLGLAEGLRGKWAEAKNHLDRGKELAERFALFAGRIDNLFFLNQICLLRKDAVEGRKAAGSLNELADRFRLPFHGVWAKFFLSRYEERFGAGGRAVNLLREAAAILEGQRSPVAVDDRRGGYRFDGQALYEALVDSLAKAGDARGAFEVAERAKSRAMIDLLRGNEPSQDKTEEDLLRAERDAGREVAEIRKRLESQVFEKGAERILRKLLLAEEARRLALLGIGKRNEELHSLLSVDPFGSSEVQGLLDENTTLFSYFATDRILYVWALTKERVHLDRIRMGRSEVRRLVGDFMEAILSGEKKKVHALDHKVYDAFLKPIIPYVAGDRIGFIPHDALHYLPFAAMNYRGRYLVDGFSLFTAPSAGTLRYAASRKPVRGLRTLAFGNPEPGRRGLEMPFAGAEVERIKRRLVEVEAHIGREATRKRALELSGRFDILHFAAHGRFAAEAPLESSLFLAPSEGDDGRLSAFDVFRMRFPGRLVTLSACKASFGTNATGDEIAAFHRAFLYAGSPSVLSTLWNAGDRTTAVFMDLFYGEIRKGGAIDEALRVSQLEMIRRGYSPRVWAPYFLAGWYE